MKKINFLIVMLFTALSYAQVGINTNTPDASSALEIESTTGGILIPRMTETQRDAIVSPASGLMIYQTDEVSGFYFYNGTGWTKIDGVAGPQGRSRSPARTSRCSRPNRSSRCRWRRWCSGSSRWSRPSRKSRCSRSSWRGLNSTGSNRSKRSSRSSRKSRCSRPSRR